MLLGNSDLLMRQEQYKDLLKEAKQERFIRANGLGRSNGWNLWSNLAEMIQGRFGKPQPPARLKRAAF